MKIIFKILLVLILLYILFEAFTWVTISDDIIIDSKHDSYESYEVEQYYNGIDSIPQEIVQLYKNMEDDLIGKVFVLGKNAQPHLTQKDIITGKELWPSSNDLYNKEWKFTEMDTVRKHNVFEYYAILKNNNGEATMIYPEILLTKKTKQSIHSEYAEPVKVGGIYTKEEAVTNENKYGIEDWKTILSGGANIGWSKEKCRLALEGKHFYIQTPTTVTWEPDYDTLRTTTNSIKREIWFFEYKMYYFEDEKLVSVNDRFIK